MLSRVALAVLIVAPCAGYSSDYWVEPLEATKRAKVTIESDAVYTEFRMPAWAPGDYQIFAYGKQIKAIRFSKDGEAAAHVVTPDVNLWQIPNGADRVEYVVGESAGNFSPNLRVAPGEFFVNGGGVLGWFVGDERNPQKLIAKLYSTGPAVCSLPTVPVEDGWAAFQAIDYDELIDSPLVVGRDVKVFEYDVLGVPHKIAAYGNGPFGDLSGWEGVTKPVVEEAVKLYGDIPYKQFIFFCEFGRRPFGGLEHKNSTRLGLWSKNPQQAAGLAAHEYVHTYNVKRVRSKVLGPFDYSKQADTGALWWLEGVTDYYASVFRYRAGMTTKENLLNGFARSHVSLMRNPARFKVTADESSMRVWESRGSNGFGGLSYYQKGHLAGVCLDLAIRIGSDGKSSLDDVMRQLYEECKDGPGFEEGRIRELCVQFGGDTLGPIYDRCIHSAEELPLDELLHKAGYMREKGVISVDPDASLKAAKIGANWPNLTLSSTKTAADRN
jgi:predicted metalloprotease with PDZ domain